MYGFVQVRGVCPKLCEAEERVDAATNVRKVAMNFWREPQNALERVIEAV